MHNKFCIIDNETVITGSYNWSIKASENFEGIVVIDRDYKLIKEFLHEFEDLIEYSKAFHKNAFLQCLDHSCKSSSFVLGMIGPEEYKYDSTQIDLWQVCRANNHATHIQTFYEEYLFLRLGLKERPEFHEDGVITKESMLAEYDAERSSINQFKHFFTTHMDRHVHAIGRPGYTN